jgi:hypothetical protein
MGRYLSCPHGDCPVLSSWGEEVLGVPLTMSGVHKYVRSKFPSRPVKARRIEDRMFSIHGINATSKKQVAQAIKAKHSR